MGNKVSHRGIDQSKKGTRSLNSTSVDNIVVNRERNGGKDDSLLSNRSVTKLEVKIFRSYTNLNDFGKKKTIGNEIPTNIKIYKKSLQKLDSSTLQHNNYDSVLRPVSRCHSLPRSFGKSKGLRASTVSISSNENMNSLKDEKHSRLSFPDQSPNTYKVKKMDFAPTKELKERLNLFEENLVNAIVARLTSLPLSFQTAVIPLALFPPCGECVLSPHSLLTLKCCLEDDSDPFFDPIQASIDRQCALFVPHSCLQNLQFVKDNPSEEHLSEFVKNLFSNIAKEAATDLARMYEYQIGLLTSDMSIAMLTNHIADRIMSHTTQVMKVPLIDRNSLVLGATKGRIDISHLPPIVVSVILGMKELKWNLYDIIDKPGLRKDALFYKEHLSSLEEPDQIPFEFFSSMYSDHMTYGYRGPILELDFSKGIYKHSRAELAEFSDEVLWRYDDFHRTYSPYFRVVGDKFFKKFILDQNLNLIQPSDLDDYVMKIKDRTTYSRDSIRTLLIPSSRVNLPDEMVQHINSDLVERIPKSLLNRSNQSFINATSPILSTDFPILESNEAYSNNALTSTPTRGRASSNDFMSPGADVSNHYIQSS